MFWDADNERDERKQKFIARMRDVKCKGLLAPLSEKLLAFDLGEIEAGEVFKAASWTGRQGETLIGDFKKRPDVILAGIAMDENRYLTGIGEMGISVRLADVTGVFSDAIVIPATSDGSMSGGCALDVAEQGGVTIEEELKGYLPAGDIAVATGAGDLPSAKIIHVFVPGEGSPADITEGIGAAITLADGLDCEALAIPGFFSESGAGKAESAAAVIEALKAFSGEIVQKIILCDTDEEIVDAWVEQLEEYDEE